MEKVEKAVLAVLLFVLAIIIFAVLVFPLRAAVDVALLAVSVVVVVSSVLPLSGNVSLCLPVCLQLYADDSVLNNNKLHTNKQTGK